MTCELCGLALKRGARFCSAACANQATRRWTIAERGRYGGAYAIYAERVEAIACAVRLSKRTGRAFKAVREP